MKARLSKRVIDEATYQGKGGCYIWDTAILGFGLRIYPTGRKSFVVTYHHKGRQRFFTLGRFGVITLAQARTEAFETLAAARKGEDPAGQRYAERHAPTVNDLADRHIDDHAKINNKATQCQACPPALGSLCGSAKDWNSAKSPTSNGPTSPSS